jgi:prolyl oligopeptidase
MWLSILAVAALAADPHAWLENGKDPKVQVWVQKQDAAARAALAALPGRDRLRKRLETLQSVGTLGSPEARPGRLFYVKREGLKNQAALHLRYEGAETRAVIDPNVMNSSGAVALDWWEPSPDGLYVAYGVSEKGSEESVLRVREADSGLDLPDRIDRTAHASVAWLPDRSGFYYTRTPKAAAFPRRVYFHRLGTDILNDVLVYDPPKNELWPSVAVSEDGRRLLLTVSEGWSRSELYIKELKGPATSFVSLTAGRDALFTGKLDGDELWVRTNEGAPRFKLMKADLRKPAKAWKTVVAEGAFTLENFELAGDYLAISLLERASSRLQLLTRSGKALREIPLPALGTLSGVAGCRRCADLYAVYESFFQPPALHRWSLGRSSLTVVDAVPVPADLSDYRVSQVTFESRDGTPVSMFLAHREGLKKSGDNPTLLTGYGGFSVSMTPKFSPSLLLWLERGGLFALPNLRGGGEYGEDWHRAGMLEKKQNTFDDFIAASRWLIEKGWASPSSLAIRGGSNGGLLVGAAMTQAPELYGAVVCSVPLLDMLGYDKFLLGKLWVPEYGSDPAVLGAYSPYHNVKKGTKYPPVLFLSGETDSRVDPMHARKMAARLQESGSVALLRNEASAGHGVGKPLSKKLDEEVDAYSFLFQRLGLDP